MPSEHAQRLSALLRAPSYGDTLADVILDSLQYALEDAAHREIHGNGKEEREYQGRLATRFLSALQAITNEPHT